MGTEQELSDANESLSDATVQNQSIAAAKRKLEAEMQTLNADLDEMTAEAKLWLTLHAWLKSSEVSKMLLNKWRRLAKFWKLNPRTCNNDWMKLKPMPLREGRRP